MTAHPRRWWILFVVLAAECMDMVDGSIVNVALPSIRRHFHSSESALQWIAGGYALALAVGLITGARLGDRFGRRRMFVLGALGFTICSLGCGLASSTALLVALRLGQGLFGALLAPQGLGIVRAVFPADERQTAFAVFGPVIGASAVLGPLVGGLLVSAHWLGGWRLVFFVNVPLGAATAAGAALLMPEARAPHAPRIDVIGAILSSGAMLALVYPLIEGRPAGWPAWILAVLAGGIALFAAFAVQQLRRHRSGGTGLVEPTLFAKRGYNAGSLVLVIFFMGLSGLMFALGLYFQLGEGYSALHAGLTFMPWSLGLIAGSAVSAAVLAPRFGRTVVQAGGVLSLGGALLLVLETRTGEVSTWDVLPGMGLTGVGLGVIIAPLFGIILAAVGERELGSASGVLNALQQLSGAVGVAVLGAVFFDALDGDHFGRALGRTLWIDAGLIVLALLLIPLLPRHARPENELAAALPAEPDALAA
jgi:EmrB/QacA subfamily drug resistance transporter